MRSKDLDQVLGDPSPSDGSSEYPVTIKGKIESTGLDGLCQPHRKIIVDLIWVVGEGSQDSIRRSVRTDSSNRFSYTFTFKVPPRKGTKWAATNTTYPYE